ncbi:HAD-IC family P-type ATPase [Rhizobium sp. RU36D]|uniref:cation-translocating P-type ATPase n=1 Tax=Rhizobium sp. RU36D TaxID=1907415 RepID=UPI0009D907E8|nr:HAD-IC family P-type ATPase [Rhizobium sp. RU36D]SMC68534.1 Ca2+-transporting ATPase [Rhizobium sp. RU36D]
MTNLALRTGLEPEITGAGTGLSTREAEELLRRHGPNRLPVARSASFLELLLRQFLSPLIYILIASAVVSAFMSDVTDALFIGVVLAVNGLIGAVQEYQAGRSADALRALEEPRATVVRDGMRQEIDAVQLVSGDLVQLESGQRVPADVRLTEAVSMQVDEAAHTGESKAVGKQQGDMVFAGTVATRGRAAGVVMATGARTELGRIADAIHERATAKPPLLIRMEQFTRNIAIAVGVAILLLFVAGLLRDMPLESLLSMSIGLAVSAIPEGLPIAITVALAISMRRMARVNVIVRNLPAVESLGSCTMIATDKTGTLTLNELTVTDIRLPDDSHWICETGRHPTHGNIRDNNGVETGPSPQVHKLLLAASLPNEAQIDLDESHWTPIGDTVDVALLAAAHKAGMSKPALMAQYPLASLIPYEPEQKYSASFHESAERIRLFVKGAPEMLLSMCDTMETREGSIPLDRPRIMAQHDAMAGDGLRVLAFAEGEMDMDAAGYASHMLSGLNFLGMVGMRDPIRPEVPAALEACGSAGISVVVITGDDPKTASVIARHAGLDVREEQIATGAQVLDAVTAGEGALDALTKRTRIYARVKPEQKLAIVRSLARNGHFVAVTGDGVNDAPALKHAHVGVAMGMGGTEVAKESADIILRDDNFASIVAGIREGRVAYANIRKVIYMLVSTGAAEVMLFLLGMLFGTPLPLTAVQLLWLNLVTNGIQDVALVTEPAEGDELARPARQPGEPIFDLTMMQRLVASTLTMGIGGFAAFYLMLQGGMGEVEARNLLLVLFVLFENFQCFNSRSERRSVFRQPLLSNPFLLAGVIGAQTLHLGAMYVPGLNTLLGIAPITLTEWTELLVIAASVLLVSELGKLWANRQRG